MACKCSRILKVMGFLILIFEVQTNDLAPISFSHYASPIQYVHPSQLDGVKELVLSCFRDWLNHCTHNRNMKHMRECIHLGATICLIQIVKQVEKGSQISECFMACLQRGDIVCYTRCIQRHLPGSDVVYMQNYNQLKVC
jgi:hypothetical protein